MIDIDDITDPFFWALFEFWFPDEACLNKVFVSYSKEDDFDEK